MSYTCERNILEAQAFAMDEYADKRMAYEANKRQTMDMLAARTDRFFREIRRMAARGALISHMDYERR